MPIPPQIVANFHDLGFLLTWVPKLAGYVGRKYSEWTATRNTYLENRIIDYLNMEVGSSGIDGMWADLIMKPIIQDVPFGIAFPVQMTGFAKFKHNLKALPYETRHRWRMMRRYVPEEKLKEVLVKLVREQRIRYNNLSQRYSRVQ